MRTNESPIHRQWTVRSPADVGRVLADLRAAWGITQETLAEEVGVDRSYLARLEGGASTLALERSLRALRRMGATIRIDAPVPDEDDGPSG
ncbi:MAG TPA: helix-turn-helix transcriptional regulator [Solirubrobacterales bacterium]|nr:helix-turn-helix transcriptional regulator [Solirubrobacterales bacterium]